jgi:hypothetical protein
MPPSASSSTRTSQKSASASASFSTTGAFHRELGGSIGFQSLSLPTAYAGAEAKTTASRQNRGQNARGRACVCGDFIF